MVNLKNGNVENSILTLEPKFGHTAAEAIAEYVAVMKDKKSFIIVADLLAISPKDDDFLANCGVDFVHIDTITGSYGSINKQFREAIDRGDNIITDEGMVYYLDDHCISTLIDENDYVLIMPDFGGEMHHIGIPSFGDEDVIDFVNTHTVTLGDCRLSWVAYDCYDKYPAEGHEDLQNLCDMGALIRAENEHGKPSIMYIFPRDFWLLDIVFY